MKPKSFIFNIAVWICIFHFSSNQLSGQLNSKWEMLETDNFIVYYPNGYELEANQALQNLEYYRNGVIKLTGNKIDKIPIIIEDYGMYSNAYADAWENKIHIFTFEPGSNSNLSFNQNWFRSVGIHEYTHIGHLTNTKGAGRFSEFLLGKFFQPNRVSPAWIQEGITVFSESQQSSYEGRINDGYFDAVIASRAKEKKLPSITAATNIIPTYPIGDWYLNGGMFFNYLSNIYGKDKFPELFNKFGSYWWAPMVGLSFPWLGLDLASKKVYGKSMKKLYKDWTEFEEEKYQNWRIDGEKSTDSGWYKSFLKGNGGKIYYFRRYFNDIDIGFSQLVEFDPSNKKEKVIADLKYSIEAPIQIYNGQIYYTVKELDRGYPNVSTWGYTSILYSVDINTGKSKKVCKDDIRAFCILNNGDILYSKDQKHKFGSELWNYSNGEKHKVAVTDQLISELEAGKAGIFVVSRRDFENWNINQLDLEDITFTTITNSPWAEFDIHLQNNKLFYSTNHNKTYSIFSYDLDDKITYKLTNEGFSRDGVVSGDSLYFIGLSSTGEDIFVKPLNFIEWESGIWTESTTPDFLSLNLSPKKGGYSSNLKELLVPYTHMFYPIGMNIFGTDALGQNTYSIGFEYLSEEKKYYINTSIGSRIFAPLYLSTYTNYIDYFYGSLSYPVYRSSQPGVSYFISDLSVRLSGNSFTDKTFVPAFRIGWDYPLYSFRLATYFPTEKKCWGSSNNRFTIGVTTHVTRKTKYGYFRLNGNVHSSKTGVFEFSNRGAGKVESPLGVSLSPSYSRQLFKLRRGFWNVNMFIEDFDGNIFVDYTRVKSGNYLLAAGAEISLETRLLFSLIRFSPVVGAAINKEGKWNYYWRFNFPLSSIISIGTAGVSKNNW